MCMQKLDPIFLKYLQSLSEINKPMSLIKKEKKFYWVFNKYGCKRKCYYYVDK